MTRNVQKSRRGMVGVEAAIVLIAFVVIASALAYVVINMGFFSAQKAKETISQGVSEATSALQLDGSVIAKTNNSKKVQYLVFPVKLSVGKSELDLSNDTIVVSVYSGDTVLLDIYNGSLTTDKTDLSQILNNERLSGNAAVFVIYNDNGKNNTVLEQNEKAFLVINLSNKTLAEYAKVKVEVKASQGAALTVERQIPGGLPSSGYVDLG
ncbi:MAG: archaellin/type IV pilin N-terminal domain-containing protein [Nitrososphaerota archaeon]|nr:archaellin/type IV pilin N-terminal domain-containing protein [Nitrososphaerota archaeon]